MIPIKKEILYPSNFEVLFSARTKFSGNLAIMVSIRKGKKHDFLHITQLKKLSDGRIIELFKEKVSIPMCFWKELFTDSGVQILMQSYKKKYS